MSWAKPASDTVRAAQREKLEARQFSDVRQTRVGRPRAIEPELLEPGEPGEMDQIGIGDWQVGKIDERDFIENAQQSIGRPLAHPGGRRSLCLDFPAESLDRPNRRSLLIEPRGNPRACRAQKR